MTAMTHHSTPADFRFAPHPLTRLIRQCLGAGLALAAVGVAAQTAEVLTWRSWDESKESLLDNWKFVKASLRTADVWATRQFSTQLYKVVAAADVAMKVPSCLGRICRQPLAAPG